MAYSGEEPVMKEMDDKTYLNEVADALDGAVRMMKHSGYAIHESSTETATEGYSIIEMSGEVAVSVAIRLREIAERL